jgi:hypothetical protein
MLVRSVRHQAIFRWKKQDVFLTEVLWGENVGLLPPDDRWFTIYFAQYPLARFDSHKLAVMPLPKTHAAGEGGAPPSLATHSIPPGTIPMCQPSPSTVQALRLQPCRSPVANHQSLAAGAIIQGVFLCRTED